MSAARAMMSITIEDWTQRLILTVTRLYQCAGVYLNEFVLSVLLKTAANISHGKETVEVVRVSEGPTNQGGSGISYQEKASERS